MNKTNSEAYARAIYEVAREENKVKLCLDILESLKELFSKEEIYEYYTKISSKANTTESKMNFVNNSFKKFMPQLFMDLFYVAAQRNEMMDLLLSIDSTIDKCREELSIMHGTVWSVTKLKESQISKLENLISKKIKANDIILINKIEPKLIGGLKVELGDMTIDMSVSGQVARIEEKIKGVKIN